MNGTYILLTILGYFGLLMLVAKFTSRHADNDAFFRGNRKSPWYVVAFGMIGASLSGEEHGDLRPGLHSGKAGHPAGPVRFVQGIDRRYGG